MESLVAFAQLYFHTIVNHALLMILEWSSEQYRLKFQKETTFADFSPAYWDLSVPCAVTPALSSNKQFWKTSSFPVSAEFPQTTFPHTSIIDPRFMPPQESCLASLATLYGCETLLWTYRWILRISHTEKKSINLILEKTGIKPMFLETVMHSKLCYFEHITKTDHTLEHPVLEGKVEKTRSRGRRRITW